MRYNICASLILSLIIASCSQEAVDFVDKSDTVYSRSAYDVLSGKTPAKKASPKRTAIAHNKPAHTEGGPVLTRTHQQPIPIREEADMETLETSHISNAIEENKEVSKPGETKKPEPTESKTPIKKEENTAKKPATSSKKVENKEKKSADDVENDDISKSTENKKPAAEKTETKVANKASNPANSSSSTNNNFKIAHPIGNDSYIWPANGEIIQRYEKSIHEGVNIKVAKGTPIKTAANGEVVYVGDDLSEYGNLVIVKHDNNILTAYAHLDSIDVNKGDVVSQGSTLGKAGQTGDIDKPQLYFSVRKGDQTINPESKGSTE